MVEAGRSWFAHTEVLVVIQNLSADPTGGHAIRYRGSVARPPRGEPGDVPFRLQWGRWEAYRFDFARDYRARYGSEPGPHRLVAITLRHRAGGGQVSAAPTWPPAKTSASTCWW